MIWLRCERSGWRRWNAGGFTRNVDSRDAGHLVKNRQVCIEARGEIGTGARMSTTLNANDRGIRRPRLRLIGKVESGFLVLLLLLLLNALLPWWDDLWLAAARWKDVTKRRTGRWLKLNLPTWANFEGCCACRKGRRPWWGDGATEHVSTIAIAGNDLKWITQARKAGW